MDKTLKDYDTIIEKINYLHCLFTWKFIPQNRDIISQIENKYGDNLNISSPEFTFAKVVGNLIIGYELFDNGEKDVAQMKMLEMRNWLEKLDNRSDEFYLSINTGIKHVITATLVHMLFATNLTEECNWFLEDIVPFSNLENKSKAAVHAIHAAILIEYDENINNYERACKYAKIACDLDSKTSCWFDIYSLVLTAQEQFLANEFQMALVELTIKKQNNISKNIVEEDDLPNLKEALIFIVELQNNGEDPIPFMIHLVSKCNEYDQWYILVQICSYTILFQDNIKNGVKQFMQLNEQQKIIASNVYDSHCSVFRKGSKHYLTELIGKQKKLPLKSFHTNIVLDTLKLLANIAMKYNLTIKNVDEFIQSKPSHTLYNVENQFYQNIVIETQQQLKFNNNAHQGLCNNLNQNDEYLNLSSRPIQFFKSQSSLSYSYIQIEQIVQSTINMKILRKHYKKIFEENICNSIVTTKFTQIPQSTIYINVSLAELSPKSSIPPWIYQEYLEDILKCYPKCNQLYTDASKTPKGSGIAIVCDEDTITYKITSECTTNNAEAVAIEKALDYALFQGYKDFIILSDSLTTITCIKNQNKSTDIIENIFKLLLKHQKQGHSVRFIWIPGHCDILGNEIADSYARQAAEWK